MDWERKHLMLGWGLASIILAGFMGYSFGYGKGREDFNPYEAKEVENNDGEKPHLIVESRIKRTIFIRQQDGSLKTLEEAEEKIKAETDNQRKLKVLDLENKFFGIEDCSRVKVQ